MRVSLPIIALPLDLKHGPSSTSQRQASKGPFSSRCHASGHEPSVGLQLSPRDAPQAYSLEQLLEHCRSMTVRAPLCSFKIGPFTSNTTAHRHDALSLAITNQGMRSTALCFATTSVLTSPSSCDQGTNLSMQSKVRKSKEKKMDKSKEDTCKGNLSNQRSDHHGRMAPAHGVSRFGMPQPSKHTKRVTN